MFQILSVSGRVGRPTNGRVRIAAMMSHRSCTGALAALLLGFATVQAQAVPLNLVPGVPDIAAGLMTVEYDAAADLLTATSNAVDFLANGQPAPPIDTVVAGTFNLSATIDDSGLLLGGLLSIMGTLPTLGFNSGTLLTGTLDALGFDPNGGDPLELLFSVTGGDAASLYGDSGGITLFAGAGVFSGSFAADFAGGAAVGAAADTFGIRRIPEPSSLLLVLVGIVGLSSFRYTHSRFHRRPAGSSRPGWRPPESRAIQI